MTREKRLGRGLEALLSQIPAYTTTSTAGPGQHSLHGISGSHLAPDQLQHPGAAAMGKQPPLGQPAEAPPVHRSAAAPFEASVEQTVPTKLPVRQIDSNPEQPRQDFDPDEMRSLVESIHAHGLLQPVVVRKVSDRYQLVAGERRLRAAIEAGWNEVPVTVVEADDRQVAELAIVENLHRKDLNPLEKAASFQRYLEKYRCTQEELASRLKIDRSTIANLIRLLELPEPVQQAVRQGKISQGHARALLPLGEEREQIAFCERIQREGLSVRQTEALVQQAIDAADAEPLAIVEDNASGKRGKRGQSQQVVELEQQFRAALGMKVKLVQTSRGRGRLVIHFRNHDEFDRLHQHICQPHYRARQAG